MSLKIYRRLLIGCGKCLLSGLTVRGLRTPSKRGYIVLQAHIRKEMNIMPGTKILIHREKGRITLESVPSFPEN